MTSLTLLIPLITLRGKAGPGELRKQLTGLSRETSQLSGALPQQSLKKPFFLFFLSTASCCPPEGPTQTPRPANHYRVTPSQLQPPHTTKPAGRDAEGRRTLASLGLSRRTVFSLQLWAHIQQCFGVLKSDWELSVQSFSFLDV